MDSLRHGVHQIIYLCMYGMDVLGFSSTLSTCVGNSFHESRYMRLSLSLSYFFFLLGRCVYILVADFSIFPCVPWMEKMKNLFARMHFIVVLNVTFSFLPYTSYMCVSLTERRSVTIGSASFSTLESMYTFLFPRFPLQLLLSYSSWYDIVSSNKYVHRKAHGSNLLFPYTYVGHGCFVWISYFPVLSNQVTARLWSWRNGKQFQPSKLLRNPKYKIV